MLIKEVKDMSETTDTVLVTEAPVTVEAAPVEPTPAPQPSGLSRVYMKIWHDDGALVFGEEVTIDAKTDYWTNMLSSGADPGELASMLFFGRRFIKVKGRFYPTLKIAAIEFVKVDHDVQPVKG